MLPLHSALDSPALAVCLIAAPPAHHFDSTLSLLTYVAARWPEKLTDRPGAVLSGIFGYIGGSLLSMTEDLIVLVEDNEDDVFFMRRALKGAGVSSIVQVLTDGQQATDYLTGAGLYTDRGRWPMPWIVFLDLKLPYCTGFEVLEAMRKQNEAVQPLVVILTSSPEERDRRRAQELGAAAYLVKPPTPAMLKELFAKLGPAPRRKESIPPAEPLGR